MLLLEQFDQSVVPMSPHILLHIPVPMVELIIHRDVYLNNKSVLSSNSKTTTKKKKHSISKHLL